MRLPWLWRRKPAAQHIYGDMPVAVGTDLRVAASDYDDDDAKSTASSEHSHLTLPVEEPVQIDDEAGSGSEEPSESDGEPGDAGHRSGGPRGHRSPRRRRSARVPAFMVAGTAAAVMLLVLAALVAWKRRQRAAGS